MKYTILIAFVTVLMLVVSAAFAQTAIPPPSNPVVFCGTQASPMPDSWELMFDGGAPEILNMDATKSALCSAATTHSYQVAASRLTLGTHTLVVRSRSAFGVTVGPPFTVLVGIAPGEYTTNEIAQ